MENKFEGYVLAGGKSSRMKKNKSFLEINSETFLERAIKTLSHTCVSPIRIVIKQDQYYMADKFPANALPVYDSFDLDSPLGGIHRALQHCIMLNRSKFAVILAVDLPNVTSEAIEKLAEITLSSNKYLATVPRQADGRPQPLCAIYRAKYCLPVLEKLMIENRSASIREFLELIPTRYIEQEKLAANYDKDLFFNVNYPSDYEELKTTLDPD